jgi:hypothetical protein
VAARPTSVSPSSSMSDGTEAETDFFVSDGLEPRATGKEGRWQRREVVALGGAGGPPPGGGLAPAVAVAAAPRG